MSSYFYYKNNEWHTQNAFYRLYSVLFQEVGARFMMYHYLIRTESGP